MPLIAEKKLQPPALVFTSRSFIPTPIHSRYCLEDKDCNDLHRLESTDNKNTKDCWVERAHNRQR
eukprot:scaffold32086_cov183-Amphora_coffeaeformis.AAC.1